MEVITKDRATAMEGRRFIYKEEWKGRDNRAATCKSHSLRWIDSDGRRNLPPRILELVFHLASSGNETLYMLRDLGGELEMRRDGLDGNSPRVESKQAESQLLELRHGV